MILKTGKTPPEGWHFEVAPGVTLRDVTREKLIESIFDYRVRNNVPQTDIVKDIDDYYCSRWPTACIQEAKEHVDTRETMLARVSRWVAMLAARMPRGGFPLASKAVTEARAAICAGCPRNRPWKGTCSSCSASTAALTKQVRQLRSTTRDDQLFGCEVNGWDNAAAVHLTKESLTFKKDSIPQNCWLLKEE